MNMTTFKPFLLLVSLLALALVSSSVPLHALSKGNYIPCAYRLTIMTSVFRIAGTTSNVSITVGDVVGNRVIIPNVVDWNITKPEHGYVFLMPGSVVKFLGREDCYALASRPCFISVTITGTGYWPDWHPESVDVDAAPVGNQFFDIQEWLDWSNNYTVVRNLCPRLSKGKTSFTKGSLATKL